MAASASKPTPKLVVADDEEGLLFLMVDGLRREGFEVEGFESGEETLAWLASASADLLLLDLKLGALSAPMLVQRLREEGREFPFIVITGHGDERTAVEVMKEGALDYVMKDAQMLDLLPAIVRRSLATIEQNRKLAEATEAIRQREERHRKIIQTALDGFVRFDAGWKVLEVNEAMGQLLDSTPERLLGSSALHIKTTTTPEEWSQHVRQLREQGFVRCFTRLHVDEERILDVEISMRADGSEVFGFIHDLSEQRRLEREVLQAGEEERRRFGCELHDNLGQQLTALDLMSTILARDLKRLAPELAKPADGIAQCARKMVGQTRQLAHGLAPLGFGAEGLRSALSELARVTAATGVECQLEIVPLEPAPRMEIATHLFRIAQEAVNNALKHSRASRIGLSLVEREGRVELSIEDNGRGLPAKPADKGGKGLQIMQHRARLVGAELQIHSKPKKGVRIVCSLPKYS